MFTVPRGTLDILPEKIAQWQFVEKKARHTFHRYNYQEIRTPLFEETELFARSMGKTSDVVLKQMLNLAAQPTEEKKDVALSGLTLRPESTASVVRSYIENSMDKTAGFVKLFYIGPMFRGERPQKGRLRQFHQIGVEAIGSNSTSAFLDAEIILLAVDLLNSFGLKDFKIKLNTLGSAEDKETFSKLLREKIKPYLKDLSADSQQRFERNVFRVLDSKDRADQEIVAKLKLGREHLAPESLTYFNQVKKILEEAHVNFEESIGLVRGLDYYTHTVFEITSSALGSQDALGAGGRYNNLVSQLGGAPADAVGFALGIERILLALGENPIEQKANVLVYVATASESTLPSTFQLVHQIRRETGLSCETSYTVASLKSQLRQANKAGARYVLILGEDEMKEGVVTFKDMEKSEQKKVSQKDIIDVLKQIKKEHSHHCF
jgi:histidyl-tRNA synthetase